MEMKFPAPRFSQYGIWDYTQIDYDVSSPLNVKGNRLCQGKPAMQPTATVTAGETIQVPIVGYAPHKGGHCQFALSYDQERTWVVIADHLRTCPLGGTYPVTIPATAPASDKVVFAWTWVNAEGNREYYMNCADIVIKQPNPQYAKDGYVTGKKLLIVNQPGYPTIPEFLGNENMGLELFNARPTITVRLSGSSTPTPPAPEPEQPKPEEPKPETPKPEEPEPQEPPTPPPTTPPTNPPTTPPSNGNCVCQWSFYCGKDSCGRIGEGSACQCPQNTVCMGEAANYQCRAQGAGGAPVPSNPPPTPPPVITPPPGVNCRCLWASYCGPDSCGVQGQGSACQCPSGTVCKGGPYFQCARSN